MVGNYPDGLSEGSPGAPWNQPDPDPVICDACDHEPEDGQEGEQCDQTWDDLKARPQRFGVRCDGKYVSLRCDQCGHLSCCCDP